MDRRKVLLVAAAVVAALGTLLVFVYVRGADTRADQRYSAVKVLRAVDQIAPGETIASAVAANKIQLSTISSGSQLPDALASTSGMDDQVALTTIYPGEQIIASKFGTTATTSTLTIPKGKMAVSVNLTDPARVAGFVNPGDSVAVFMAGTDTGADAKAGGAFTRLLMAKVPVIGVGTTTVVPTTTTDTETGAQTTEQLPRTLLTLAVDQADAQRLLFASSNGELALGLLNQDSVTDKDPGVTAANLFS